MNISFHEKHLLLENKIWLGDIAVAHIPRCRASRVRRATLLLAMDAEPQPSQLTPLTLAGITLSMYHPASPSARRGRTLVARSVVRDYRSNNVAL